MGFKLAMSETEETRMVGNVEYVRIAGVWKPRAHVEGDNARAAERNKAPLGWERFQERGFVLIDQITKDMQELQLLLPVSDEVGLEQYEKVTRLRNQLKDVRTTMAFRLSSLKVERRKDRYKQ